MIFVKILMMCLPSERNSEALPGNLLPGTELEVHMTSSPHAALQPMIEESESLRFRNLSIAMSGSELEVHMTSSPHAALQPMIEESESLRFRNLSIAMSTGGPTVKPCC